MFKRVMVAVVGVPFLILVLGWAPDWATMILVALMCAVGAWELLHAIGGEAGKSLLPLTVLAAALGCVLTRQSVARLRYDPERLAALLTGRSRQETEALLRQAAEVFIRGADCPEGLSAYLRRSVPVLAVDVTRAVSLGHPEAVLPLPVEL